MQYLIPTACCAIVGLCGYVLGTYRERNRQAVIRQRYHQNQTRI